MTKKAAAKSAKKAAAKKSAKTDAEKAAQASAEQRAAISEADSTFREEVKKAAEKRDAAIAKATDGQSTNVAEQAWNETKADDDLEYKDITSDFRTKLDVVVDSIRTSGSANVAGLEAFEEKVKELLTERDEPIGGQTAPTGVERAAALEATK